MALLIHHVDTANHGDIEVEVSGGVVYMTGEGKPRDADDPTSFHMEYLYRRLTAKEALRLGSALIDCGIALMDQKASEHEVRVPNIFVDWCHANTNTNHAFPSRAAGTLSLCGRAVKLAEIKTIDKLINCPRCEELVSQVAKNWEPNR